MTDVPDLERLLAADPVDAGCAAGFEVLHRYVEDQLAGRQPEHSFPGLSAHLRSCPACRADYSGLIQAAEIFGAAGPPAS